jgi:sugar phosphate isomerase/epimerase
MQVQRRSILAACAGAFPALSLAAKAAEDGRDRLGLVIHSFPVHQVTDRARQNAKPFADPIRFLEHCHSLGVHSVQVGIGVRDPAYTGELRARAEAGLIHLEGIVSLPKAENDLDRFEAEVATAKQAGATILRTVTLAGRRYETLDSAASFRKFRDQALYSLNLAARVARRQNMRLAVENHKDWRSDELIAHLDKVGCDEVGVCLDTGNSIALLEDPMEVVETLAPRALTTHFKDMGLEEYPEGFLLSEVPLGTGILDLKRAVWVLRRAQPEIRFNIEMITRDPLAVPCLTDRYWSTFPDLPGKHLARTLSLVRAHVPQSPLPRVGRLRLDEQIQAEDDNIKRCLAYARRELKL